MLLLTQRVDLPDPNVRVCQTVDAMITYGSVGCNPGPEELSVLARGASASTICMEDKAMSKSKGFKIGRDDDTGRLKSVAQAKADPKNSSVEIMPKKGHGDTGRYDNKKK